MQPVPNLFGKDRRPAIPNIVALDVEADSHTVWLEITFHDDAGFGHQKAGYPCYAILGRDREQGMG